MRAAAVCPATTNGPTEFARAVEAVLEADPSRVLVADERTMWTGGDLRVLREHIRTGLREHGDGPVLLGSADAGTLAAALLAASSEGRPLVVSGTALDRAAAIRASGATTLVDSETRDGGRSVTVTPAPAVGPPQHQQSAPETGPSSEQPLLSITTSGSTGIPRLCHIGPAGVLAEAFDGEVWPEGPREGDHHAHVSSLTGVTALTLARAMVRGACTTWLDPSRTPPGRIIPLLDARRATSARMPASLLRRLATTGQEARALKHLRTLAAYGEALLWSDVRLVRRRLSASATVLTAYATVQTGRISLRTVRPDEPIGEGAVGVGHPLPGRRVSIQADGADAASDGSGSVVVEGAFDRWGAGIEPLGRGLVRVVPGDRARFDPEGRLELRGRDDRMVKIAATRVEPAEVEDLLLRVPGVHDAAAVPVEVTPGEQRIIAHVMIAHGGPAPADLLAELRGRLPAAAVPARILVAESPLPRLDGGKLDLQALRSMSRQHAVDPGT